MKPVLIAAAIALSFALAPSQSAARNYDCTKAANANKAVCKNAAKTAAAAAHKPAPSATKVNSATVTKTKAERTYDCTKRGNANKAQCKASGSAQQATAKPVSMPKATTRATTTSSDTNPAGAIARCKDGTYSHAKSHRGACSHHGGVANWLG